MCRNFDLNSVRVTAAPVSTLFSGKPVQVPVLIEAENFDRGGERLAYHDNVAGNSGGQYRPPRIPIFRCRVRRRDRGVNATGTVVLANTGGRHNFGFIGKVTIALAARRRVLKIVCDRQCISRNEVRISASAF